MFIFYHDFSRPNFKQEKLARSSDSDSKKLMLRKTIQIVLAFSDFFKLVNEQQKQKFDLISPEANLGFSRRGRIFRILVDSFFRSIKLIF